MVNLTSGIIMATPKQNIKHTLYKLKRRFGTRIGLYNRIGVTTDLKTGVKSATLAKAAIGRAIVLQARDFRTFSYDLAFISANKDFTMGGYFDPSDRRIIIDKADMPVGWVVTVDQYVVIGDTQYKVSEFGDHENAIFLLVRALKGEKVVRVEESISIVTFEHYIVVEKTR